MNPEWVNYGGNDKGNNNQYSYESEPVNDKSDNEGDRECTEGSEKPASMHGQPAMSPWLP